MITHPNWLVPLDIAKKLKDIGFDLPCAFVLTNKDRLNGRRKQLSLI